MNKPDDLKVFIASRESKCQECGEELGCNAWIMLTGEAGAQCLTCSDLDHLVFLPSGDAALTRRTKKHSKLSAVVLKWSRPRKRYERQGLLVENEALEEAEKECEADADQREMEYPTLRIDHYPVNPSRNSRISRNASRCSGRTRS